MRIIHLKYCSNAVTRVMSQSLRNLSMGPHAAVTNVSSTPHLYPRHIFHLYLIAFRGSISIHWHQPGSPTQNSHSKRVLQYTSTALAMPLELGKLLLQVQWVPRDLSLLGRHYSTQDELEDDGEVCCLLIMSLSCSFHFVILGSVTPQMTKMGTLSTP